LFNALLYDNLNLLKNLIFNNREEI